MSQIATENAATGELGSAEEQANQLTAADRCDSCGAQAYVRVTIQSGELLFCAHHGAKFKDKLAATALEWHDESHRLSAAV
ncbi:MAG: hypothetical protein ABWX59_04315 [Microbacteriaceae bacterium]